MNIKLDQEQSELILKKTGVTLQEIQLNGEDLNQISYGPVTTMALGEEDRWF
ncbi:hypothetical protein H9I32_05240 [Bacillus sp. Xin]|uniref:hypothetical protein n=1 Tax=Bacillus TaxID=1386 RepID=UPI00030C2E22|nr:MULTISPECIES: hypothetical protein [Bacillus]MBC6971849.1 hypothetical protein [Bacillus sp. Xin]MCI0768525.1 hypothetical protein [Bacillus sp. TL12]NSW39483.1 hypothetical protein [Bacillus sp. Xin1]